MRSIRERGCWPDDRETACLTDDEVRAVARKYRIRNIEGVVEWYHAINKKCEICKERPALFADHCHVANKFRGFLCRQCNTGLGMFQDRRRLLAQAIIYLEDNEYVDRDQLLADESVLKLDSWPAEVP